MTRAEIKNKIWEEEYFYNGFHKLNGVGVIVRNLRITKKKAFADIILITDAERGISERYNNCEYDLIKLLGGEKC